MISDGYLKVKKNFATKSEYRKIYTRSKIVFNQILMLPSSVNKSQGGCEVKMSEVKVITKRWFGINVKMGGSKPEDMDCVREKLELETPQSGHYLNQSKLYELECISDANKYHAQQRKWVSSCNYSVALVAVVLLLLRSIWLYVTNKLMLRLLTTTHTLLLEKVGSGFKMKHVHLLAMEDLKSRLHFMMTTTTPVKVMSHQPLTNNG